MAKFFQRAQWGLLKEVDVDWSDVVNKPTALSKITESEGSPLWDGAAWPGGSGSGDMLKSAYDTNNDGKVNAADSADAVAWSGVTGKPTSSIENIDTAVTNSHTHSNKVLLDSYTQTEVNLASAVSNIHTHSNKTAIDLITESGGSPLWNGSAWPGSGTGGDMSKAVYDTDDDGKVNSAEIADSVPWAGVTGAPTATAANIDTAVTNSHTHSNKTTLDAVTEAFTTALKSTYDGYASTISGKQDSLGFTAENSANKGVANGYASLGSDGLVPIAQLPTGTKECDVVADITARNALSPFKGLRVYVVNATGDATVASGGADYIHDGSAWIKTGEAESMDVVVDWANLTNKPTSSVANIDASVTNSHTHSNKTLLDTYTQTDVDLASAVSGTHAHSNKTLLDSYTQTEVNLASAVTNNHTHTNKTTLDAVTEAFTTALKSTYDGYATGKQDALGFTAENSANKGVANGYAGLDSGGKVPTAQLPTISSTDELVKTSSDDTTAGYLDAKIKNSIVVDAEQLQLSGDAATPGNSKYYGTNASGTKGFYDVPTGGGAASDPVLTTTTLIPSTTGSYVALYTNSTGAAVELDFASIINTATTSRDVYLRITAADGTTLVHTVLPKTTLETQAGIEVEDGKYVIANGQILQCQTSGDLTEFYVVTHSSDKTPNTLTTYTADTWTDVINNTTGSSQRIDLISISNPSTTASVSVQLRIATSAGVLVNTVLPATGIEPAKGLENKSGRWVLADTQKLQVKLSVTGCDVMATTKANA